MEPITLFVLALFGALAGAAVLTWTAIKGWVDRHRVRGGTAKLLRTRLASGQYKVVGGVFTSGGARSASHEWVGTLDADLERQFGTRQEIVIRYGA